MNKIISKLIERTKKFMSTYKKNLLAISLIFIGVFSFKFFYDYRQEQKEIIYRTVDDTKFYNCNGYLFGLNQSPQDRYYGEYSTTTFVLYEASEEGVSMPYIAEVKTVTETDFLNFRTHSSGSIGRNERPVYKLNRLTGKLHSLKGGKTYRCGLLDDFCADYTIKREEDYHTYECNRITESLFKKEFNRQLDLYNQERQF